MRLSTILDPSCVLLDVGSGSKREVLARLAAPMFGLRPELDRESIVAELARREAESSTAIADGIAIPHAKSPGHDVVTASFGRSREGIDFDSLDGKPTRLLVVLVSPVSNPALHVKWLAHVARVLADAETRRHLLDASTVTEILDLLHEREHALALDQDIEPAQAAKDAS